MNVPIDDRLLGVLPHLLLDAVHFEQQVSFKRPWDHQLFLLTKTDSNITCVLQNRKKYMSCVCTYPNEASQRRGCLTPLICFPYQTLRCYIKWEMAPELNEDVKNAQVLAVAEWTAVLLSSADSGYADFIAIHTQRFMIGHSHPTAFGHQLLIKINHLIEFWSGCPQWYYSLYCVYELLTSSSRILWVFIPSSRS
jgi:hypothetical protein